MMLDQIRKIVKKNYPALSALSKASFFYCSSAVPYAIILLYTYIQTGGFS